jgi:glycine/D-amino acid oxidase-like deaminating enzyme
MLPLPSDERSLWQDDSAGQIYPSLSEEQVVDIAIVGAGITGLTAAYLLKMSGLKVAVLEKRTVGAGTTGRTTGKVTSLHRLIYADLQRHSGTSIAKAYGQANQAAVEKVKEIIKQANIACDWQDDDNYTYTTNLSEVSRYRQEAGVARELGLPATFENSVPLPFRVTGAVKFTGQGKFNSQKYVLGLAQLVDGDGSHVFEDSKVTGIRDGAPARVRTSNGTVHAKDVIVATNVPTLPLLARGGFCLLEYPTESYIIAGRPAKTIQGMYISKDKDNHSILPIKVDGEDYLLIGGAGNISGLRLSKEKRFRTLADYAERHFGMTEITHKWSDRDYLSYDDVPLIGKLYPWSKHVYVGTAYHKWGLSNGTAAGMILHDLITGTENPWAWAFTPRRLEPVASIPRVAVQHLTGKGS